MVKVPSNRYFFIIYDHRHVCGVRLIIQAYYESTIHGGGRFIIFHEVFRLTVKAIKYGIQCGKPYRLDFAGFYIGQLYRGRGNEGQSGKKDACISEKSD